MRRLVFEIVATFALLASAQAFADTMFWADNGSVYRANMDGTGVAVIHNATDGYTGWVGVDSVAQKVYMRGETVAGDVGVVRRLNYDGSGREVVLTGLNAGGYGLGLDSGNNKMYFGDYPGGIYRANYDGSGLTLLPNTKGDYLYGDVWADPNLRHTHDMQVVGDKLYYTNDEFTELDRHSHLFAGIRRSDLDGSNVETIVDYGTSKAGFICLAVDTVNGQLYWSEDRANSIFRSNLDGSGIETFLTDISAYDLEIDAASQMLYFTTSWDSTYLGRIGLDGTGLEQLVTLSGVDGAKGLALATGTAVPTPSSLVALIGMGLMGLFAVARRRRRT